eukprot:15350889-Ditylum_brightwellii.AAC.1
MKYLDGPKSSEINKTNNQHLAELHRKPLHGLFFQEQAELVQVDLDKSHKWIWNAQLRGKMEAVLCAAQEQALATNNVRLYLKHNETITHIASGYPKISKKKFIPRHEGIAKYLHWCLLKGKGDNVPEQWHKHKTPTKKEGKVVEFDNRVEMWWNETVKVDRAVEVNHPNIVLLDQKINQPCYLKCHAWPTQT